ncbi:hypothetical protein ACFQWF_04005 [Methylorubrum suomiense]
MLDRVRPASSPLPWTVPSDCITSVEDWMTFGGATWPEGWSRGAAPSSFTVDVPGGSVPAVGWSMALPADCAAAGSATTPRA